MVWLRNSLSLEEDGTSAETADYPGTQAGPGSPVAPGRASAAALKDVFFDFDNATIKERPFLLGHDESAWMVNRRAHFVKE